MYIVAYRPDTLFQRYLAAYGGYTVAGPSRAAVIKRVCGLVIAEREAAHVADDISAPEFGEEFPEIE